MEGHILIYLILGSALLGMTILPRFLDRVPLTLPSLYVLAGILLFCLPLELKPLSLTLDAEDQTLIEYFTEILVVFSLAGAGLKLDREFSWRSWGTGWRLILVTMPLSIAAIAWSGSLFLGLVPASALLLGALLAPTDPVLAEDVQVGGPHEGDGHEVKFGLTLEAGLNDALAFPFVYLAIAYLNRGDPGNWWGQWLAFDLAYRVLAGVVVGVLAGKALSFYLVNHSSMARQTEEQEKEGSEGIFIVAAILIVYSVTELVNGYGFLAVFVAAVVGKRSVPEEFNRSIFRFVSQFERLLLAGLLIAFGGMLTDNWEIFHDWRVWTTALVAVFLVRPIAGMVAFIGSGMSLKHRAAISFFGIRGVGSIYYLAYALRGHDFPDSELIWFTLALTICLSIVIHGLTASKVMQALD